jgi:hypothetical protein
MLGIAPLAGLPVGGFRFVQAGNAYILTADAGVYAITGTAASLKAGRLLVAYDNLIPNGRFSLDTVGWTVDGADTSFDAINGMGVLALGPTAVDGFTHVAIAVTPGQLYNLSGILKASGYLLTANPGAYVLTGTAADLFYDSNLLELEDLTLTDVGAGPGQHVGYKVKPTGVIVESFSDMRTRRSWLPRGADGSDYEIRATHISGDVPVGTYDTWLQLNTARNWTLTENAVGTLSGVIFIEIRLIGTTPAGTSATITMTVTRTA